VLDQQRPRRGDHAAATMAFNMFEPVKIIDGPGDALPQMLAVMTARCAMP
jgi:hypothetical protein